MTAFHSFHYGSSEFRAMIFGDPLGLFVFLMHFLV